VGQRKFYLYDITVSNKDKLIHDIIQSVSHSEKKCIPEITECSTFPHKGKIFSLIKFTSHIDEPVASPSEQEVMLPYILLVDEGSR
jgi:hypothetical protein